MSESFYFESVDRITIGTLGPKGQRVFYLQSWADNTLLSLKFEKQQAAALGRYLERVLKELPPTERAEIPRDLDLREPVVTAWTIGTLGIGYDPERDIVVLMAQELTGDEDEDAAEARFVLSRPQVVALVARATAAVAAGRPPCPYCRRPLEPANGDWCPCNN